MTDGVAWEMDETAAACVAVDVAVANSLGVGRVGGYPMGSEGSDGATGRVGAE